MVNDKVVIVDVGRTIEDGVLYGDVEPKVYEKASIINPKTGLIGPLSISMFLKNVMVSYKNKK